MGRNTGRGSAWLGLALALLSTGCATGAPHAAIFGQLASPIGAGQAEVALSAGPELQLSPSQFPGTSGDVHTDFPVAEGRASYGLSQHVELQLRANEAGVAPGVKVAWPLKSATVALVPQVAVGYVSGIRPVTVQTGSFGDGSLASVDDKNLNLMPSLRVLLSGESLYGGVGYDFLRHTASTSFGDVITASSGTEVTAHYLTAAFGYSTRGTLMVRPEVVLLFCPSQSTSFLGSPFESTQSSSSFWAVLPSVTFALRSAPRLAEATVPVVGGGDERLAPPPLVH